MEKLPLAVIQEDLAADIRACGCVHERRGEYYASCVGMGQVEAVIESFCPEEARRKNLLCAHRSELRPDPLLSVATELYAHGMIPWSDLQEARNLCMALMDIDRVAERDAWNHEVHMPLSPPKEAVRQQADLVPRLKALRTRLREAVASLPPGHA